jgi:hypothetical protein
MRARRTFTLDAETFALLMRVGNYSDYANKLFLQHARQWTAGLAVLRERGWGSEEILAACDALAGYSKLVAIAGGEHVADELERIETTRKHFSLRKISTQRRARCFEQVRSDSLLAAALVLVVSEYWLENQDCHDAIRNLA